MTLTKKEMANMRNVGKKLSSMEGKKKVISAFTEKVEETSENGEKKIVEKGYIKTEDGEYYGTMSPTAIRNIEDIVDILDDGEEVMVSVLTRKSNSNRNFISLMIE